MSDEQDESDDSGSFLTSGPDGDTPMSFFDHLAELRKRLLRAVIAVVLGFVIAWIFRFELQNFLNQPLADAWASTPELPGDKPQLQNLAVFDVFLVHIRIAVTASLFVSGPFVLWQIWMFVSPGLYNKEKNIVVPFVFTSAVMFILGAGFCYIYVIPVATSWFLQYPLDNAAGSNVDIVNAYTFADYTKYMTRLLLAFGLVFEFPLGIYFLARVGAVTHKTLIKHWKVSVVGAFLIGAFLTPPEPITQVLMAMPMVMMYFGSIGVAYWASKPFREQLERREAELAAYDAEEAAKAAEAAEAGESPDLDDDDDDDAW